MRTRNIKNLIAGTLFFSLLFMAGRPLHAKANVLLGIDVLEKQNFSLLKGKRVGLITNSTGFNSKGKRTIDLLFKAPDVKLVAIFSPEHGVKGMAEHGENVANDIDKKTKLPVYSLYGETKRPTQKMLEGLDVIVFDIQDIGTRFYTYTTTLAYALEEAAKRNIEFVVLDRPNPITGEIVEGEVLSPEIKHFTAYLQLPVRHGFTVGEIANWYNLTASLNAKLTVVKMEGWRRSMWWDETKLKFRPTSPNIKNLNAATLYPGIGALEATNVSVGRGTGSPFEIFGAPWMDGEAFLEQMNFAFLPGFDFKAVKFKPKNDLYKGELCKGVKVIVSDRNEARAVDLFIAIVAALNEFYPEKFKIRWDEMARVTGSNILKEKLESKHPSTELVILFQDKANKFKESRKSYLLYE